ncbi:MAG TPA: S8 family serine peptidase [Terriglobales bacterium]|nr:S8 family serine peptidase [Terriglobales bacterium]
MKRLTSASSLSSISLATSHILLVAAVTLLLVIAAPRDSYAQTGHGRNNDVITHKFQPRVSPESLAPAGPPATSKTGIAASALGQIQALQLDKAARTQTQKKISSKLIYTARMLQGQPAAPGVPFLNTGVDVDDNGNMLVDITANFTDDFLDRLRATGAQVLTSVPAYRGVRALIPANKLETIAAWSNVIFIAPKREAMTTGVIAAAGKSSGVAGTAPGFEQRAARVRNYLASVLPVAAVLQHGVPPHSVSSVPGTPVIPFTGQGSVTTQGDLTHKAFEARQAFGVNGAGLKIGVLSDGVTRLALSQASGDLANVTVLEGQTGEGDEGTAMLEIIHDMAPGAALYFATAFNSLESFAQNIHDLRTAGCDIIVDDVFYFVESPFVDGQTAAVVSPNDQGLILQAVDDVTADGALYFSSAGNQGNLDLGSATTYESDYVDGGPLTVPGVPPIAPPYPVVLSSVHNFGTTASPVLWNQVLVASGGPSFLYWSDPLGASTNDYDLFVLDPTAKTVVDASTDTQDGTQDPVEAVGPVPAGDLLVVSKFSGDPRYFHLNMSANGVGALTFVTNGTTHGHNQAALAYGVAATPAAAPAGNTVPGPYPNFFNTGNEIEFFSADGPRRIFFEPDMTPITPGNFSSTGGLLRQKPDITAADGVSVTGTGGDFPSTFYGTSAAAPSAASVAALVKSAKSGLTPDQIRTALTTTAVDIMAEGVDRDSGAGIVMAWDAVNSLGVPGFANPELGDITATDHPGNGDGFLEGGEGGIVTIKLKNTNGVVNASGITATLSSPTGGITVTQPPTSTYPNMPARSAAQFANVSPFTFTLASNYPCGQAITFNLALSYTGGPSRTLTFTVPTGPIVNISTTLGTPTAVTGVTTETGTLTAARISRNAVPSTCATTPKAFPGTAGGAGNRAFDGYTFMATHTTCTPVTMTSDNGVNLFTAAYSPDVVPTNLATGYFADAGSSNTVQSFGMETTAGKTYTLILYDVPLLETPSASAYNLQFSGCAFYTPTVNHPPVAKATNVTVGVAPNATTASASINDGSFDPDGDPITITQIPPGPYALGTTPGVLLTVVDPFGATSQATASVTVVVPTITVVPASSAVTVAAGGAANVNLTITGNLNFSTASTLGCVTTAAHTSCGFNPSSLTVGTLSQTVALSIQTKGSHSASNRMPRWPGRSKVVFATLLGMPMFVFMVPLVDRRRGRKRHRVWPWMGFLLLLLLLAGCGTSAVPDVTSPGVYPVQVNVTVGPTTGSAVINLTVTD